MYCNNTTTDNHPDSPLQPVKCQTVSYPSNRGATHTHSSKHATLTPCEATPQTHAQLQAQQM
jgi:hypothetical protein